MKRRLPAGSRLFLWVAFGGVALTSRSCVVRADVIASKLRSYRSRIVVFRSASVGARLARDRAHPTTTRLPDDNDSCSRCRAREAATGREADAKSDNAVYQADGGTALASATQTIAASQARQRLQANVDPRSVWQWLQRKFLQHASTPITLSRRAPDSMVWPVTANSVTGRRNPFDDPRRVRVPTDCGPFKVSVRSAAAAVRGHVSTWPSPWVFGSYPAHGCHPSP
ncbi:hypothetical protein C4K38_5210 [Pseudomonas chlororaphis subsp. piscium]|nr:hypothetical protein C4K38_5210 [Pseudomonas chlororaphis subsp. piscium]SDS40461.1 hypothetical protein SAMN05216585_2180 [Pseudomonas chlororaphis]